MIKLTLLNNHFSPLDGELTLEKLLQERQEDVFLSCDEPSYKMTGGLEHAAAEYLSSVLPYEYEAKWDEASEEGYRMQKTSVRELPPRIKELRFRVFLQKRK